MQSQNLIYVQNIKMLSAVCTLKLFLSDLICKINEESLFSLTKNKQ